jgi:hypothetical protein
MTEQQRTTAFIYTRPAPSPSNYRFTPLPPLRGGGGRRPGRWVPPCILFGVIVVSLLCSAGRNPFAGVIMLGVFGVLLPTFWWGWIWGMGRSNYKQGDPYFGRGG